MADRPDLSPHIVHLTRDYIPFRDPFKPMKARDNLLNILRTSRIEARTPYGIAVKHLEQIGCNGSPFMDSQRVACFSETPLAHLSHHVDPGMWRRYNFKPYGLAFSRQHMLNQGANEVWYVNQYKGNGFRWLVHDINELIDEAALTDRKPDSDKWQASQIAKLAPFMEAIGTWKTGYNFAARAKDFSWEREWRFRGNFTFLLSRVEAVIVPGGEIDSFREELLALPLSGIASQLEFVEMEVPEDVLAPSRPS